MNIWESISNSLKARKGEFTGTSGNENKINERLDENESVNITNPTSQRTFHRDADSGSFIGQQIDIGDTTMDVDGELGEVVSSAIESARYDPDDDSLNITYKGGDKEYKFQAGGLEGVEGWVNAPSKGQIIEEWRTTHRYPGY